jgi:hypothetical protein
MVDNRGKFISIALDLNLKKNETRVLIFVTQVVFAVGKVTVLYEFELMALEVMMMEIMETEAGNCVTNNTVPVSVVFTLMNLISITTCCLVPE